MRSKIGATIQERLLGNKTIFGDNCWGWAKYKNACGYGVIGVSGKTCLVHRVSYEAFVGSIPEGMYVLHKCDNPSCFNPDHLFLGTQTDNMKDMASKLRGADGDKSPKCKLSKVEVHQILDMLSGGSTCTEISRKFHIDCRTVREIAKKESWKNVDRNPIDYNRAGVGSQHALSKLSEEDVSNILSSGLPSRVLAKEFGVVNSTIQRIRRGTSWNHVARPQEKPNTCCRNGHEYVDGSFYFRHGSKICRVCMKNRYLKYRNAL